jgi:cation diffusion facilitator CzcD-associated flavoprotein CzcO
MHLIDERPYIPDDIPSYPQCTPQPLKIIHVGAGASGILFAHKAEKQLKNYELICYEKNDVIGGTWYENRSDRGPCRWRVVRPLIETDTPAALATSQHTHTRTPSSPTQG